MAQPQQFQQGGYVQQGGFVQQGGYQQQGGYVQQGGPVEYQGGYVQQGGPVEYQQGGYVQQGGPVEYQQGGYVQGGAVEYQQGGYVQGGAVEYQGGYVQQQGSFVQGGVQAAAAARFCAGRRRNGDECRSQKELAEINGYWWCAKHTSQAARFAAAAVGVGAVAVEQQQFVGEAQYGSVGHGSVGSHTHTGAMTTVNGFENVVVRVPTREHVSTVVVPGPVVTRTRQGPPRTVVRKVQVQGPEQVRKVKVEGPSTRSITKKVKVPGPDREVIRKVEVNDPDRVIVRRVEVQGEPVERVIRKEVPGATRDITKEVKKHLPDTIVTKRVEVQGPDTTEVHTIKVPGPAQERTKKVKVPGPAIEKTETHKVKVRSAPREVVRKVKVERHVVRQVVRTVDRPVPVHQPVMVQGPPQHRIVKYVDPSLNEINKKLKEQLRLLRNQPRREPEPIIEVAAAAPPPVAAAAPPPRQVVQQAPPPARAPQYAEIFYQPPGWEPTVSAEYGPSLNAGQQIFVDRADPGWTGSIGYGNQQQWVGSSAPVNPQFHQERITPQPVPMDIAWGHSGQYETADARLFHGYQCAGRDQSGQCQEMRQIVNCDGVLFCIRHAPPQFQGQFAIFQQGGFVQQPHGH